MGLFHRETGAWGRGLLETPISPCPAMSSLLSSPPLQAARDTKPCQRRGAGPALHGLHAHLFLPGRLLPQGAHNIRQNQTAFGHRAKPHLLPTEIPSTRILAGGLSPPRTEAAKPTRPPAAASVLTWCPYLQPSDFRILILVPAPRSTSAPPEIHFLFSRSGLSSTIPRE